MCEIFVADNDRIDTANMLLVAADMFESNSDGLGCLAVYREDDYFEYEPFAQATPNWQEFLEFLQGTDDAFRHVIHARLATLGETTDENTHPLEVGNVPAVEDYEGPSREPQWVVHNGVVSNHRRIKSDAEQYNHEYNTDVDSESIAHAVGHIPGNLNNRSSNLYGLRGSLNFMVFSKSGILVHNTGKYELTTDFTMTTCRRQVGFDGATKDIKWMLVRPDDQQYVEVDRSTTTGSYNYSGSRGSTGWGGRGGWDKRQAAHSPTEDEDDNDDTPVVTILEDEVGQVMKVPDTVENLPDWADEMFVRNSEIGSYWSTDRGDSRYGSFEPNIVEVGHFEDEEEERWSGHYVPLD